MIAVSQTDFRYLLIALAHQIKMKHMTYLLHQNIMQDLSQIAHNHRGQMLRPIHFLPVKLFVFRAQEIILHRLTKKLIVK